MRSCIIVTMIFVFVIGAASIEAETTPAESSSAKKSSTSVKESPAVNDSVAVTVNGKDIMESQIELRIEEFIAKSGRNQKIDPEQLAMMRNMYRKSVVEALIGSILVKQDSKKLKMTVNEKDIDQRLEEIVQDVLQSRNMTREELEKELKTQTGKTIKQNLEQLRANPDFIDSIMLNKVLQKKYSKELVVKDDEINKFYEENLETRFKQEDMVRASHILIDTKSLKTDEEKQAAKEKGEKILIQVQAKDADFAALAKEYSACPSKRQGGDLNFFPRTGKGSMVEPFAAAAFKMQPGQICGSLVETQFGYHIIKVTDRKPGRTIPFDEVKDKIKLSITNQKKQQAQEKYIESLKKVASIVYPPGKEIDSKVKK